MPIINPSYFYWLEVLSNLKGVLNTINVISIIIIGVLLVALFTIPFAGILDDDDEMFKNIPKKLTKWMIITLTCCVVVNTVNVFVPTKETMIQMLISKNATYENVDNITQAIKDTSDYIFDKLNGGK